MSDEHSFVKTCLVRRMIHSRMLRKCGSPVCIRMLAEVIRSPSPSSPSSPFGGCCVKPSARSWRSTHTDEMPSLERKHLTLSPTLLATDTNPLTAGGGLPSYGRKLFIA